MCHYINPNRDNVYRPYLEDSVIVHHVVHQRELNELLERDQKMWPVVHVGSLRVKPYWVWGNANEVPLHTTTELTRVNNTVKGFLANSQWNRDCSDRAPMHTVTVDYNNRDSKSNWRRHRTGNTYSDRPSRPSLAL